MKHSNYTEQPLRGYKNFVVGYTCIALKHKIMLCSVYVLSLT